MYIKRYLTLAILAVSLLLVLTCVSVEAKNNLLYGGFYSYDTSNIFVSGDCIFIADITEANENDLIRYSHSLEFREPDFWLDIPVGMPLKTHIPKSVFLLSDVLRLNRKEKVKNLWKYLYDELSDVVKPDRFKIPYAFAFNLTLKEHILCEVQPEKILDIIQGKEAILTWSTPEIQWGDKLRIRYLQDYIKLLKENGHVDWAETIETLEGKTYLYGGSSDVER